MIEFYGFIITILVIIGGLTLLFSCIEPSGSPEEIAKQRFLAILFLVTTPIWPVSLPLFALAALIYYGKQAFGKDSV